MKNFFIILATVTLLYGAGDQQPSRETSQRIDTLTRELAQKEAIMKSLEKTLASRDRAYREMAARNKSLIQQIRTDKVSRQERESLKRAVIEAKEELALAKKELKGGSTSVVQLRAELSDAKATIASLQAAAKKSNEKKVPTAAVVPVPDKRVEALQAQLTSANATIQALKQQLAQQSQHPTTVTKIVEPTEKLKVLQTQLAEAQATIANLKGSNGVKTVIKEKVVEKIVYKDCPVEKVVYKDRPIEKVVEKIVYKDRPIEKIVYKDRPPVVKEKVIEKVVYKDRPIEKVVEKIVYKDRPIEKVVEKSSAKKSVDEATQRRIDKLALELERAKSSSPKTTITASPSVKTDAIPPAEPTPKKSSGASSAYRMATNAPIYSAPYGRQIDTWEARRSFTAGPPSNGWVHITGYFVNRVWQPTQEGENLYVKESDVIRR